MKAILFKSILVICSLVCAETYAQVKFTFYNATNKPIAINVKGKNIQINPKESTNIYFLPKNLPAEISLVNGPALNQWSSQFTIEKAEDTYYVVDWQEGKDGLILTATKTEFPSKPNSK